MMKIEGADKKLVVVLNLSKGQIAVDEKLSANVESVEDLILIQELLGKLITGLAGTAIEKADQLLKARIRAFKTNLIGVLNYVIREDDV